MSAFHSLLASKRSPPDFSRHVAPTGIQALSPPYTDVEDQSVRAATLSRDPSTDDLHYSSYTSMRPERPQPPTYLPFTNHDSPAARSRRSSIIPYNGFRGEPRNTAAAPPKKHLIVVIPSQKLLGDHATHATTNSPSSPDRHSQGILMPLLPSMYGQLTAVAREFGFPSTTGLCVYLEITAAGLHLSPRVSEESWPILWAHLLEEHGLSQQTPGFPIAGRIEVDIDIRKARWYESWVATLRRAETEADMNSLPGSILHRRTDSRTSLPQDNLSLADHAESPVASTVTRKHIPRKLSLVDKLDTAASASNSTSFPRPMMINRPEKAYLFHEDEHVPHALSPVVQEDEPETAKWNLEMKVKTWRASSSAAATPLPQADQQFLDPVNMPNSAPLPEEPEQPPVAPVDEEEEVETEEIPPLNLNDYQWSISSAGPPSPGPYLSSPSNRAPSVHLANRLEGSVILTPSTCTSFGPGDTPFVYSPLPTQWAASRSPDLGMRAMGSAPLTPSTATSWGPPSVYLDSPLSATHRRGNRNGYEYAYGYAQSVDLGMRGVHSVPLTAATATSWGPQSPMYGNWPESPGSLQRAPSVDLGYRSMHLGEEDYVGELQRLIEPEVEVEHEVEVDGHPWHHVWPYQHSVDIPIPTIAITEPQETVTLKAVQSRSTSGSSRIPEPAVHIIESNMIYPALDIYPAVYPNFNIYPHIQVDDSPARSLLSSSDPNELQLQYLTLTVYPAVYPHFNVYPATLETSIPPSRSMAQGDARTTRLAVNYPFFDIYPAVYPHFAIYGPSDNAQIELTGAHGNTAHSTVNYPYFTLYPAVYPQFEIYPSLSGALSETSSSLSILMTLQASSASASYPYLEIYPAIYPHFSIYPDLAAVFMTSSTANSVMESISSVHYPLFNIYPAVYPAFDIYPAVLKVDDEASNAYSNTVSLVQYPYFNIYPSADDIDASVVSPPRSPVESWVQYPFFDIYPAVYPHFAIYPASLDIPSRHSSVTVNLNEASSSLVRYPAFNIYPAVYPYFDVYPASITDTEEIAFSSSSSERGYPVFDIYPAVYPHFDVYPSTHPSARLSTAQAAETTISPLEIAPAPATHISKDSVSSIEGWKHVWPYLHASSAVELEEGTVFEDAALFEVHAVGNVLVGVEAQYPVFSIYPAVYPAFDIYPAQAGEAVERPQDVLIVELPVVYPLMSVYPAVYPNFEIYPPTAQTHITPLSTSPPAPKLYGLESIFSLFTLPASKVSEETTDETEPIVEKVERIMEIHSPRPIESAAHPEVIVKLTPNYPSMEIYRRAYPAIEIYPAAYDIIQDDGESDSDYWPSYPSFDIYPAVYPYFDIYHSGSASTPEFWRQEISVNVTAAYPVFDIYRAVYPAFDIYNSGSASIAEYWREELPVALPDRSPSNLYSAVYPYFDIYNSGHLTTPDEWRAELSVSVNAKYPAMNIYPAVYPHFDVYGCGAPSTLEYWREELSVEVLSQKPSSIYPACYPYFDIYNSGHARTPEYWREEQTVELPDHSSCSIYSACYPYLDIYKSGHAETPEYWREELSVSLQASYPALNIYPTVYPSFDIYSSGKASTLENWRSEIPVTLAAISLVAYPFFDLYDSGTASLDLTSRETQAPPRIVVESPSFQPQRKIRRTHRQLHDEVFADAHTRPHKQVHRVRVRRSHRELHDIVINEIAVAALWKRSNIQPNHRRNASDSLYASGSSHSLRRMVSHPELPLRIPSPVTEPRPISPHIENAHEIVALGRKLSVDRRPNPSRRTLHLKSKSTTDLPISPTEEDEQWYNPVYLPIEPLDIKKAAKKDAAVDGLAALSRPSRPMALPIEKREDTVEESPLDDIIEEYHHSRSSSMTSHTRSSILESKVVGGERVLLHQPSAPPAVQEVAAPKPHRAVTKPVNEEIDTTPKRPLPQVPIAAARPQASLERSKSSSSLRSKPSREVLHPTVPQASSLQERMATFDDASRSTLEHPHRPAELSDAQSNDHPHPDEAMLHPVENRLRRAVTLSRVQSKESLDPSIRAQSRDASARQTTLISEQVPVSHDIPPMPTEIRPLRTATLSRAPSRDVLVPQTSGARVLPQTSSLQEKAARFESPTRTSDDLPSKTAELSRTPSGKHVHFPQSGAPSAKIHKLIESFESHSATPVASPTPLSSSATKDQKTLQPLLTLKALRADRRLTLPKAPNEHLLQSRKNSGSPTVPPLPKDSTEVLQRAKSVSIKTTSPASSTFASRLPTARGALLDRSKSLGNARERLLHKRGDSIAGPVHVPSHVS